MLLDCALGRGGRPVVKGGCELVACDASRREVEKTSRRGDNMLADFGQGGMLVRQLRMQRCHADRLDAAWNDEIEEAEIGRDVEREAVPSDPVARVYSDRRDLAVVDPNA